MAQYIALEWGDLLLIVDVNETRGVDDLVKT
jgi:hypothetical protein